MSSGKAKQFEEEMKAYRVQGFTCTNCAAIFENNVKELPGVQDAKVNFGASKVYVKGKIGRASCRERVCLYV